MQRPMRVLLVQSILFESSIKSAVADAQFLSGFLAVAMIALKGLLEHLFAQVVKIQALKFFLGLNVFLGLGHLKSG